MPDYNKPDFKIYDNGSPIGDDVVSCVIQVTVDDSLDGAAVATVRLRDERSHLSDGSKFKVGNGLKIELGYVGQTKQVFIGEVTGWRGNFPRRGNQTMTVIAHDKFHRLRRNRRQKTYLETKDSAAVDACAKKAGLSTKVSATPITQDSIQQWNQTDADFILERAFLFDMEVYVDDGKLIMREPKLEDDPVASITWHEELQHFATNISLLTQQKEVKVTAWKMKDKVALTATAKKGDELSLMGGTEPGAKNIGDLISEPTWFSTTPAKTQEEVDAYAKARFRRRSEQYLQGEGICDGDPTIQRGKVIELKGLGDLLSGTYYARRVVHTLLSGSGYSTTFRVIRTAIRKPAKPMPKSEEPPPYERPEPPALLDPGQQAPGPASGDVGGDPHSVDPAVDGGEGEASDSMEAEDSDDPADEEVAEEEETKHLRLMFVDEEGEGFKNKPFDITIGGETISGTTSPDGRIIADVPAGHDSGEVTIHLDDGSGDSYTWPITISE